MKHWHIYIGSDASLEVVKDGFSWPAFFLVGLWAFYKRLYWQGSIGLGITVVLNGQSTHPEVVTVPLFVLLMLLYGFMGNGWVCARLERESFSRIGRSEAASPEGALAQFRAAESAQAPIVSPAPAPVVPEPVNEQDLMEKYEITFDGAHYHYEQYKYSKLQDAVNYAKLKSQSRVS